MNPFASILLTNTTQNTIELFWKPYLQGQGFPIIAPIQVRAKGVPPQTQKAKAY